MATYVPRALSGTLILNDNNGYMVLIGGQPVFVKGGTLSIDNSIGRRSTASFTVRTDTVTHFEQYQQVLIYDANNTLAFSGYISSPKEQVKGVQSSLEHTITCIDQHFLADKRRVVASFTNKTCGYVAQWLVNNVLNQEGVTIGQIYDGLTPSPTLYPRPDLYPGGNVGLIGSITFAYCKVSEALDKLVEAASSSGVPYYWQIDELKQLWFVPYTSVVNSAIVDGSQIDNILSPPSVTRSNATYRNVQYVAGGTAETLPQDESRKGDGTTTAWTMSYELAHVPTITVNGIAKSVGISGVETGKDFYWNEGSNTISQDGAGVKLTSSDTLRIQYIGRYPSIVISQNGAQIAYQAMVDGTTGLIEDVEQDASITSVDNGLSEASQLLTRYAQQGVNLTFTTRQSGFQQGQLITVNLPMFGLDNAQMLIEKVTAGDQLDGLNIYYQISAVIGPYNTSWVDFFSALLKQPQVVDSINVGVSQTITVLQPLALDMTPSMTLTANSYACPLPSPTLYPRPDLYPC